MFATFFFELRAARVPTSLREYLMLMEAMKAGFARYSLDEFYALARTILVKDERHLDRFDQVFGHCFKGLDAGTGPEAVELPEEWLRKLAERHLTEDEKAAIETLGGWDKLMETLRQRLAEQKGRHQGGSKWIGTAGTSPFGAHGYNPEGVRIGQEAGRHRRAVKVWDKREFKNLDDGLELGTRNMKVALRRLRRFAREGAADELDIDATIGSTARNAGWLDLKLRPERHNALKLLLLLDVGGSMDDHVGLCEELFSAARAEFKHLAHLYFHNCPYETLWTNARRRHRADAQVATLDLARTYDSSWRVIFVGDATMSPYELTQVGGAVEHWNMEPGRTWLARLAASFPKCVWLNPVASRFWAGTPSIRIVQDVLGPERMFPLTLEGLDRATATLSR